MYSEPPKNLRSKIYCPVDKKEEIGDREVGEIVKAYCKECNWSYIFYPVRSRKKPTPLRKGDFREKECSCSSCKALNE